MSLPTVPHAPDPRRNLLLGALPASEYGRLQAVLEPVSLEIREPVYERGKPIEALYFPVTGVLSLVSGLDGEVGVEVATIGYEGVSGLPLFLGAATSPHDCFCQIAGDMLRLPAAELQSFLNGDGALHDALHRYTQATMVQLAQS